MEFAHLICDEASAAMQEHRFFAADEEDGARARWQAAPRRPGAPALKDFLDMEQNSEEERTAPAA